MIVQWIRHFSVFPTQNLFSLTMFNIPEKHGFQCFSVFWNISQSHPWEGVLLYFDNEQCEMNVEVYSPCICGAIPRVYSVRWFCFTKINHTALQMCSISPQTNTDVLAILRAIDWAKFHFCRTIIISISSLICVM